jgi:hypothetical protein
MEIARIVALNSRNIIGYTWASSALRDAEESCSNMNLITWPYITELIIATSLGGGGDSKQKFTLGIPKNKISYFLT